MIESKQETTHGHLEYFLPDLDESVAMANHTGTPILMKPVRPFVQAATCAKFYRFLGGRGRRWIRHEFFHADLDTAWYGFDPHAAAISKIVPPGVKLTRREWKVLRRRLGPPRRFSKSFIAEELKKRNRFRREVRRLQLNPDPTALLSLSVPPILQPGTKVTAYNKRYQILHQGSVLFHSRGDNGYFIQFNSEELGCEFCPDTEVSRHNPPPPLGSRTPKPTLKGSVQRTLKPEIRSDLPYLLKNDRCYERYTLASLMANLKRLIDRKKAILDALEELNHDISPLRRSKHRNFPKSPIEKSTAMKVSIAAWLHSNLTLTNKSLRQGREILEAGYPVLNHPSTENAMEVMNGSAKEERKTPANELGANGFDKKLMAKVTEDLIRAVGGDFRHKELHECTQQLLEMEMRRLLKVPPH